MDGQRAADSLQADLRTLQQELCEMQAEGRPAAAQRSGEGHNDQGGIVIRGK